MSVRSLILLVSLFSLSSCFGMGVNSVPAPVYKHGNKSGAGSVGVHNVVGGDTLYSISNRYRLTMQDIVVVNRLKAPFILHEGQRLRLPPPHEYKVQAGDTIYKVSRVFGVNSSEVARLNDIDSPYIIHPNQVLRLPSVVRKTQVTKAEVKPASKPELKTASAEAKPSPAVVKDGVPQPQAKPTKISKNKSIRVSKVRTKAPKRSSSKFKRPIRGKILSDYGVKKNGLHNDGINIAAKRGSPVKAAENGVVVYSGNALKGSGNLILVRHSDQWMTAYAHLDKMSVRKGQVIKRGSVIGKVGSTGSVATPQLHFEVRRGTSAMNPTRYLEG